MKTLHQKHLIAAFFIPIIIGTLNSSLLAQNVAINSTGNQADPSAMLDVASTSAGVLIPRMTTAQRSAISSPAIGLQIYNTDCGELNYWNGTCWLSSSASLPAPYPITGVTTACVGATGVTYSVPSVIGATGYNWSVPGGATITSGQSTTAITVTFGSTVGTVCVTANDACETSPAACITVNISTGPPTPGNIAGLTSVCTNSTAVTYSVAPVFGATSYTWSLPTGATGSSTTNSITVNYTGATAGNASLCVAANNGCGAGSSSCIAVTINPLPSAAGTITGSSSVCVNQSNVSYSVPSIANSNASGYTWAYSGTGATISGSGNTVTLSFSSAATSGNLTVMGTNSCGNGVVSANYPITVNPLPAAAGSISGTATVCQGARAVSYSLSSITGATSYTWSYSGSGDTLSGTTNPVTINFSSIATAGNLTVSGTNSCGNGTASSAYAISVNPLPAGSGTISGTAIVCQNQTGVSYSVSGISGASSYTWGYTGTGATITGATSSVTISFSGSATAGNLTVSGANSCGNGTLATYPIAISPPSLSTPGSISGNNTVCTGGIGSYFVSPVTGATSYTWTFTGSGATISSTTNQVDISFSNSATSGNLSVTANNGCGASASSPTFAITVNGTPNSAFSTNPPTVTFGTSVNFIPADNTNQLYFWTLPGPQPGPMYSSTESPTFPWYAGVSNVTLTVTKNGCNSTTTVSMGSAVTQAAHGTTTFTATGSGTTGSLQYFYVPLSGVTTLTIAAYGAQGGNTSSYSGGQGAEMKASFSVNPGEVFTILVGQQGLGNGNAGGGGGGTFVAIGSTPLIVAGGGGGADQSWGSTGYYNGAPGLTGTSGGNGCSSSGGTGGNGGGATNGTGGGGGFYTNGASSSCGGNLGGTSFLNGGAGVVGCNSAESGGYGGGSSGDPCCQGASGAGGGYSGGGGSTNCSNGIAGAGGSFIASGASTITTTSGAQTGNGQVVITY